MSREGKTGVSANTPKNIPFGAGTIHKGLTYTAPTYSLTQDTDIVEGKTYYTRSGTSPNYTYTPVVSPVKASIATYYEQTAGGWNFSQTIVGATSGGSKLTITPEITNIEVDGALVNVKGLTHKKTGETAKMEINFIELTKDILKAALIAGEGTSADANYDLIESKADIAAGDYWTNIAFVGKDLEGKNLIVIMENALCTSGMEFEGKNKEASVGAYTFECCADLASGDLETLPYHIYYPKATV